MAKNNDYWIKRAERRKAEQMAKAEKVNEELNKVYAEALEKAIKDVEHWYLRYAMDNKLPLPDAKRILNQRELAAFKMTLKEYIRLAKKKNLPTEYINMLNQASIRKRLDRAQQIFIQLTHHVEILNDNVDGTVTALLKDIYESSRYKTAYETQKMFGEFDTFGQLDEKAINTAIHKPWANDGQDFTGRWWQDKQKLASSLQTEITQSLMTGEGVLPLTERIRKRFNVSFSNARRLVETESAYVDELASIDTYKELDVEKYEIVATLDNRTSDICRSLDGKIYDMKDAVPGVTTPPFHAYCRSTIAPADIIDEEDTRAARDPITGKTVFVDGNLTYEEWKDKYVK